MEHLSSHLPCSVETVNQERDDEERRALLQESEAQEMANGTIDCLDKSALIDCPFPGCSKKFKWKSYLDRHYPCHGAGEKRYACTVEGCSYRASQSGNLKVHMLVHSEGKKRGRKEKNPQKTFDTSRLVLPPTQTINNTLRPGSSMQESQSFPNSKMPTRLGSARQKTPAASEESSSIVVSLLDQMVDMLPSSPASQASSSQTSPKTSSKTVSLGTKRNLDAVGSAFLDFMKDRKVIRRSNDQSNFGMVVTGLLKELPQAKQRTAKAEIYRYLADCVAEVAENPDSPTIQSEADE